MLVDKPFGWTSADVVGFLKKRMGVKKIGHAGTLDPRATGLLIILIGDETKRFGEFQKMEKEYIADIELGFETTTGDSEGEITTTKSQLPSNFQISDIKQVLSKMEGESMQTPPIYSAVKINGVPAYKLARKGKIPELKPKKITVYTAELIKYDGVCVRVKFVVSSGTYIRTLVVELGRKLGSGATLINLQRTRIGEYKLEEAEQIAWPN